MSAHPFLYLPEEDILCATVTKQAVQLYSCLWPRTDRVKAFTSLLQAIKGGHIINIFNSLLVELVVEALKTVAEVLFRTQLLPYRRLITTITLV